MDNWNNLAYFRNAIETFKSLGNTFETVFIIVLSF